MYKPSHLYISSTDRVDYNNTSPSNFSVKLQNAIQNAESLCLSSALIPLTFYNIINNNNTFYINETLITIPIGCYNLNELLQQITSVASSDGYPNFSIAYNSLTSQITMSNNTNFTLNFTGQNMATILGFLQQLYSGSNSYTGSFQCNIFPLAIMLNVDVGASVVTSNPNLRNGTFLLPCNVNKSEFITFNDKTQFTHTTKVTKQLIDTINIKVTDIYGNILQGLGDFFIAIQFNQFETKDIGNKVVNNYCCE